MQTRTFYGELVGDRPQLIRRKLIIRGTSGQEMPLLADPVG